MSNKTIVIGVLIVMAAFAGGFWYFNQDKEEDQSQMASVTPGNNQEGGGELPSSGVSVSEVDGDLVFGDLNAPITMIEYSSHTCGHCVDFHLITLPIIIEQYVKTGKVKLISRILSPLELGRAVLCGHEQSAFEGVNEYFFRHIGDLNSIDDIKSVATELGLNQDDFNQCLDSDRNDDRLKKWFEDANSDEVTGTPIFFINGEKVVGNQPLVKFERIFEKYLSQ